MQRLIENREIAKTGCWLWTRSCTHNGYGQMMIEGKMRRVHRVAASTWLGFDLDSPLLVLHRCDTPRCFNPAHLYIGTAADNTADMMRKGRHRHVQTQKPIAPKIIQEAMRLVEAGHSQREAARRCGISHTTVQNYSQSRPHQS